jgi:hypothetical protein
LAFIRKIGRIERGFKFAQPSIIIAERGPNLFRKIGGGDMIEVNATV